ncbi:hypothetical protein F8S13_23975 [Chloroflexia bacterium SDU3-3]|nr:hypothetical protein F8S13_23975 [Chloroflexia bacterium SDU3-3]
MTTDSAAYRSMPFLRADLAVALVVALALAAGAVLRTQSEGRTSAFQSADAPIQFQYPAGWREVGTLQGALLSLEDPYVESAFKTRLTVDVRDLDPAAAPTLEQQVNRAIAERSTQQGYHFLAADEALVGGITARQIRYAYVAQPIDEPRRPSLPVVVVAREYVVVAGDRTYYLTLAAPEAEYDRASQLFDRLIASVRL